MSAANWVWISVRFSRHTTVGRRRSSTTLMPARPVPRWEGINNKARVITKRTYGLKSAKSLWDRLILDLNRASQAIGYSIEHIRQMAKGLKALFDGLALKNGRTIFRAIRTHRMKWNRCWRAMQEKRKWCWNIALT